MLVGARVFCALGLVAALIGGPLACPAAADTGQAFTLNVQSGSAVRAFREALGALRGDRLRGIVVRSALSDHHDRFVEGFISANYGDTPVVGVLFAGGGGLAAGVIDTPARFRGSLPSLMQRLRTLLPGESGGGASNAPQPLHRVSYDGGSVALPAGWQLMGGYQGCIQAGSQQDHSAMVLGCDQAGVVPPGLPGTDPRVFLIAPCCNPAQLLGAVMHAMGASNFRVDEAQRVESGLPYGQAGLILFDYEINGIPFRGLSLINVAPHDQMSYQVHKTMILTPRDSFARLAPTLWRSWQSWGVSADVLTGRMVAAAQTMRQTNALITGSGGSGGSSGSSAGFSQYILDTATVEHIGTGARADSSYINARDIVDKNPNEFRILNASEVK